MISYDPVPAPTPAPGFGWHRVARSLPWALLALVIGCAFVVPLVVLTLTAFRTDLPGLPGTWTLAGFAEAFTDTDILSPLFQSFLFAVASATGGTAVALFFVFLSTRTTVRLRRMITPMMIIILATPALFFALSWGMLGADRVGLVNKIGTALTGQTESIFSINSWAGLIFVMSIKLSAFSYFLLLGPSLRMSRALEEAAEVSGSGRAGTFFRIYLPLLSPAITGSLLIGFIGSLQAFDTPQIIGTQAGIRVLSTEIFNYISLYPANYAAAASLSLGLVGVLALLVAGQLILLKGRDYTTVGGRAAHGAGWSFPKTGWLMSAVIVIFAAIAFLLPTLQLVLSSLNTVFGRYDSFSLKNYETILRNPTSLGAVGNTVLFMVVGGFLTVLLGAIMTYALRARPAPWKRVLEVPTWIPWAMPGIVGSLAILGTILAIPALHGLYGTAPAMFIALVIASLPIAMRFTESSVLQIDHQLVDAARVSGASGAGSFRSVVLPIIAPSFVSGWFVTGLAIAGNLEIPLLLGSTKTTTIAGLAYKYYVDSASPRAAAIFCLLLLTVAAMFIVSALLRFALVRLTGRTTRNRAAPLPADPAARPLTAAAESATT
ncbi:ABC transporter permease [Microlunatus sp. GCM10028923]|uniref:ABC transporter permease n=1 Tax=Microlunatus sp. GCM10028923 TaxID=3273400 RepID=UPI00361F174A